VETRADENGDLRRQLDVALDATVDAFRQRDMCLSLLARMAVTLGLEVYLALDARQHEDGGFRHVLGIELPSGRVGFHVHDDELGMFSFLTIEPRQWEDCDGDENWRRVLEPGKLLTYVSMRRANGEMPCTVCGKLYRQHPFDVNHIDSSTGEPWLHVLCDGSRVKL
jgi:hypothetical protein